LKTSLSQTFQTCFCKNQTGVVSYSKGLPHFNPPLAMHGVKKV
jgi:hypothetical protein